MDEAEIQRRVEERMELERHESRQRIFRRMVEENLTREERKAIWAAVAYFASTLEEGTPAAYYNAALLHKLQTLSIALHGAAN
jgi:hypothetical protein